MSKNQTLAAFSDGIEEIQRVNEEKDSDEYGSPQWFINRLQKHVSFDLDPAAGAEPVQIADQRYTKEDDGLSKEWGRPDVDSIYLNPPYSDPEPFLRRLKEAVDPSDPNKASLGISLTRADTSTGWFHDHLTEAEYLFFRDDRYSFHGGGDSTDFDCAVAIFGEPPQRLLHDLANDGVFYTQYEVEAAIQQDCLIEVVADGGATAAMPVTTDSPTTTPGGGYGLDFVAPYDELTIKLSENQLVGSFPDEIRLQVLPNGKSFTETPGEIEIDAIGVDDTGTDICARIRNNPNTLTSVEVTIARGMDHWEIATPTEIIRH